MESESIRLWMQALNMLGTVIIGAWMYLEKRSDKTNERINDLAARHEELDKALREVKSTSGGHLRHDDLKEIYVRLNSMDAKLNSMAGEFKTHSELMRMFLARVTDKGLA
jgi:hypothetical protein